MQSEVGSLISVPNNDFLSNVKAYNKFLKSIFIGKLKSLTTIGGHSEYLSANSVDKIELNNEICSIMNSVIKNLPFHNAYCGIIMSGLLAKLWSDLYDVYGPHKISCSLNSLKETLLILLDSMKSEGNVNIPYLQSLVASLLVEEPAILLNDKSTMELSLQIVKSVILAKTENQNEFGQVGVYVTPGFDRFFAVNGVICEIDDSNVKLLKQLAIDSGQIHKILLFAEDVDESCSILPVLKESNIKIIFCQKRVSENLKFLLRRNHILVIERGGEYSLNFLERLTGAVAITHFASLPPDGIIVSAGDFTNVKLIFEDLKNIILIENFTARISYLFVQCRSFSDLNLIQKIVDKSVTLVKSVVACSYFLPGPIVFEENLISSLKLLPKPAPVLNEIILIFTNILKDVISLYQQANSLNETSKDSFNLKNNALVISIDTVMNILEIGCIIRKN